MMINWTLYSASFASGNKPFVSIKPDIIKSNRILFVHSLRKHNVVINDPDNLKLLFESSYILRPSLRELLPYTPGDTPREKEKVLPSPGLLSTPIFPPCDSMNSFEIARPKPVPL